MNIVNNKKKKILVRIDCKKKEIATKERRNL